MPRVTSMGEAAVHKTPLEKKFPGYKIVLVSKSEKTDWGVVPQTQTYEARGFIVLSEDPMDSGHPDNVVMGKKWGSVNGDPQTDYLAEKAQSQADANCHEAPNERMTYDVTKNRMSEQALIDSLPSVPLEDSTE